MCSGMLASARRDDSAALGLADCDGEDTAEGAGAGRVARADCLLLAVPDRLRGSRDRPDAEVPEPVVVGGVPADMAMVAGEGLVRGG